MKMPFRFVAYSLLLNAAFFSGLLLAADEQKAESIDFARQILPILSNKCFICHGPDVHDEDALRLDSFAGATADRGGYRAINIEKPEESAIFERIHSADEPMPPEDAQKQLTEQDRQLISSWIRQGGTYSKHWAFVPPKAYRDDTTGRATSSEIDAFVLARLNEKKIGFAPQANSSVLARRVSLVLTGLPPEPQQLSEFLADDSADAYGRLVDQLLESTRFGEHQARYWLDAVRYGDTHGLHLDNRRGIYPYRDWVIDALNSNLPLDEFVRWQLAGDLLPQPTLAQRVATGFVRMNPSTSEGGAIPAEFQAKNNFDRTETLGTALLGMSLTCARCHTHKYDPVTQTEYYRLLAFFNSTAENSMDGNSYTYGNTVKAPANQAAWKEWHDIEAAQKELLIKTREDAAAVASLSEEDAKKWQQATDRDRFTMLADPKGPFAGSPNHEQSRGLAARISAAEAKFTTTLVAKDLDKPRETKLLQRGEYNLPVGEPLVPGTIAVMGAFSQDSPRNRLGLAQWLTSRDHPLVSRVLINRIWQRTFGDGLVRTPEDFGLQGEQPTHPKLLDFLAVELQESGWDLKHMLRLMVMSETFRQRSAWRSDVDDPENRLWARGPSHRLDAEVLRDMALWASGLLDPHMGGEGVKPYQPDGMWAALAHPGSNTKKYVRDKGDLLYRRSLYVYWKRTSPHPMMMLFDAPDRETSCVKRSRTTTSLQSLGLLNETQRIEMSRKLAERLLHEAPNDKQRLDRLFTLLACREPTDIERATCEKLLQSMRARYADSEEEAIALLSSGDAARDEALPADEVAAWSQLSSVILASDVAILLY